MKIVVRDSKSPIAFSTKGSGAWKVWDRFITIEGKDAFHVGNVCGTCSFFFQRLEGANQSLNPRDFQDQLSSGLTTLTEAQATTLSELLPDGEYNASLLFRIPRLVSPGDAGDYFCNEQPELWGIDKVRGLPHDPRTKYYRGSDQTLGEGEHLYEFIIPTFTDNQLDPKRVLEFEKRLCDGKSPTALAISVLDVKQPANWVDGPAINTHWCLAHYVIDGHHKLFAGARTKRPVGLISILALDQGLSGPEEHARLLSAQKVAAVCVAKDSR